MYFIVYKTTNLVNGKIYVGVHKSKRKTDTYLGSGVYLHRAIEKYGKENFVRENLFYASSEEEMYEIEEILVDDEFITRKTTYNFMVGGKGNSNLGQFVVEQGIGIHALSFEERSYHSKINQANRDPVERYIMCSDARVCIERKAGIHGFSPEERSQNAKKGNEALRKLGKGFFNSDTQRELSRRGTLAKKGKVYKRYTDGVKDYIYNCTDSEISFEEFLENNTQFVRGRPKVKYKPRPKMAGKKCITNGIENLMLNSIEEANEYIKIHTDFRLGKTIFKKKNLKS